MGADGVADPVEMKVSSRLHSSFTRRPPTWSAAPGAKRFVQRVLLVSKSSADVRLDHPDPAPGNSQGLPHHPADNMGNLGGGHHYDPPCLLIGKAAVIFNVAVLDRGGVVPALHLHKVRP